MGKLVQKELLFSVGIKDCKVDTFRSGGPGGQHQNKTSSGVRITHIESGAIGTSRETRSQPENKKRAFVRMVNTPEFKAWYKLEVARRMGAHVNTEVNVDEMMKPENLKIEVKDEQNKWVCETIE